MAKPTDMVIEGGGLRVSYDDRSFKQFTWQFINNRLSLTVDGTPCSTTAVKDIIDNIDFCPPGTALYAHLFGTSGDHLSANSVGQVGTSLTQDEWTAVSWDNVLLESHDGLSVSGSEISLSYGEWDLTTAVALHDTSGASATVLGVQFYDVDNGIEVPFSFVATSLSAKSNAPKSIATSTQIDLTDLEIGSVRKFSVRVRSEKSSSVLGYHASFLPAGSTNNAGILRVTRIG